MQMLMYVHEAMPRQSIQFEWEMTPPAVQARRPSALSAT
jgi:hypothetical protein